jgi:acyl-CoA synthetase (AMP-forming)/AMP-acid ligase II
MDTREGPFMRTGDLGFMQGSDLFIAGRLKDLIIIDGSNHYPQDIERTVEQSHPAIRQSNCAAFAVEVEGEERLVVVAEVDHRRLAEPEADAAAQTAVDAAKQTPVTETTIVRAIRRAVSENHDLSLHAVVLLKRGSLPKTTSGKIQRRACREGFINGTLRLWESNK